MKYITHDWPKEYDGVLYFIQRLEEMLFHYSDDIVRAPMHNTATLIKEYIELDKEDSVYEYHKDLVIAELEASFKSDEIIKEKYGQSFVDRIVISLGQSQRETVYYLNSMISLREYYTWSVEYILNNVTKANNKEEICSGLRKWIASVIRIGYSSSYIYRYLHSQFKNGVDNPIEAIKNFLHHFNLNKEEYRVYINFLNTITSYKELIKNRLNINFCNDGDFSKLFPKSLHSFTGYLDVEAIDPYSASEKAYNIVNIFISFYRVLSNHRKRLLGKSFYVKNIVTGDELYVPIIPEGYKAIEVESKEKLHTIIDNSVLGCQEKKGYKSLRKVIELHNKSLNQNDYDDGFINLWSILEVVSSGSNDNSKIDKVLHSVLPILQNDYFEKYFGSLHGDLVNVLPKKDYRDLVDSITENGKMTYKIACFTLLDKYEQERENLFFKLVGYPNIRQKIYRFYELRKDKKTIFKRSEDYAQRLKWHICRLYRMRNKIVHSGEQDNNVRVLGEHLHIYCDGIIFELIVKLSKEDSFQTIQDVLLDTRLLVESKKELFNKKNTVEEKDIHNMFAHYLKDLKY